MVDEKTGLFNFREFRRRLREEWSRARRYDTPVSDQLHFCVFPNGVKSSVKTIVCYRVNDEGKIVALRSYWTMDSMNFEQPEG